MIIEKIKRVKEGELSKTALYVRESTDKKLGKED